MPATDVENIAKEAALTAIDIGIEEFKMDVTPSAEEVRMAARELIHFTEILHSKYKNNVVEMQGNKNNIESVMKFSKKMVQTREDFKELMQRVLDFQNISNAFLGQKVQMTFVYINPKSGQVTLYAVDNNIEDLILDQASKSHGGDITGRYSQGRIKKMAQQIINSKYDSSSLETTFEEVYERYKISKNVLKLKGAAYILWKDPDWDGAWISGVGPLGEAYVNFFINEYKFMQMLEGNVKDFMMNPKYGAVLADNASGFLQGDVTKGAIEFGVKINGATALGYMDIINYARELLNATDIQKYLENLKKILNEKGVNNMVRPLAGQIDQEVNEILKPLIKNRISDN